MSKCMEGTVVERVRVDARNGVDDLVYRSTDELTCRNPEHAGSGSIDEGRHTVGVHAVDALARGLEQDLEPTP
jgi:hypothetical protein